VTTFEQANESKLIPALLPILNAVEMNLKLIGYLLQSQTLCQSEHPLRAHSRAVMAVINAHLVQRPPLFTAKLKSQSHLRHLANRSRSAFDKKNLAIT